MRKYVGRFSYTKYRQERQLSGHIARGWAPACHNRRVYQDTDRSDAVTNLSIEGTRYGTSLDWTDTTIPEDAELRYGLPGDDTSAPHCETTLRDTDTQPRGYERVSSSKSKDHVTVTVHSELNDDTEQHEGATALCFIRSDKEWTMHAMGTMSTMDAVSCVEMLDTARDTVLKHYPMAKLLLNLQPDDNATDSKPDAIDVQIGGEH